MIPQFSFWPEPPETPYRTPAVGTRADRSARGRARRGRFLLRADVSLVVLLGATLLVVGGSCQQRLQPPPVSHKPSSYRPATLAPTPLAPPGRAQPAAVRAEPEPSEGRDAAEPMEPTVEPAALRVEPGPPAMPPGPTYDAARPCLSEGQMTQARLVLFAEDPGAWGDRWMRAINGAFHDLRISCVDEDFLVLVLTTIQLESGVTVDPGLENPDLDALFMFHLEELRRENPIAGRLLNYSGLDDAMRAKLRADSATGRVRTERDLVRYVEGDLRTWMQDYLQTHYFLPAGLARYAAEQGLPNPVNTIGPMQVNLHKAFRNARARGEPVESEAQMRALLLERKTAMERGIKEGVYQLWRTYRFYRRRLPPEDAVRYTTADYNAGEFSSRNAAFQERVAALARRRLTLDGDLLVYQAGQPAERASNTEAAVITVLNEYAAPRIRRDLLLEKTEAFSRTHTARRVCQLYRGQTGQPCAVAAVPAGAVNAVAQVKLGRAYTPENYASAYVGRWEENRRRFGPG